MYSEDDHKNEDKPMTMMAKIAWMAVVWISVMMLMSTCSEPTPVDQEPAKRAYEGPLDCYQTRADDKLICDMPQASGRFPRGTH